MSNQPQELQEGLLSSEDFKTLTRLKDEHRALLNERRETTLQFDQKRADFEAGKKFKKYLDLQELRKESVLSPSEQAHISEVVKQLAEFDAECAKLVKKFDKKISAKEAEIDSFVKHAKFAGTKRKISIDRQIERV